MHDPLLVDYRVMRGPERHTYHCTSARNTGDLSYESTAPLSRSLDDGHPDLFRTSIFEHLEPLSMSSVMDEEGQSIKKEFPADGGLRAWLFMIPAFMIEGVMWGFPLTYGVFQKYYEADPRFQGNNNLAIVGTLATGVSYLATPLMAPLVIKYPLFQKHMIWAGWLLCIISLVASSFSTKLWNLILTQGILYGVGFLFMYYPLLSMLNEWFIRRRGEAYGILFASAGICGLALPFIIERALRGWGYANTLRAYAIVIFALVGPTLPLLRNRTAPTQSNLAKIDFSILLKPKFLAVSFSNIFQGLAFFLPSIFITSYASAIGLSNTQGTLILALFNLTQVLGQIGMGYIADRLPPYLPMGLSSLFSALFIFTLWGLSHSFIPLLLFGILYGLVAGGYSVLYCRFQTDLAGEDRAEGLWLYSMFEFQRGAGNIVGGLVSGVLTKGLLGRGYGAGKYEPLILVVGGAMAISSLGGVAFFLPGGKEEQVEEEDEMQLARGS